MNKLTVTPIDKPIMFIHANFVFVNKLRMLILRKKFNFPILEFLIHPSMSFIFHQPFLPAKSTVFTPHFSPLNPPRGTLMSCLSFLVSHITLQSHSLNSSIFRFSNCSNFQIIHSYLKASTGFLVAALQLCQLTVNKAIMSASIPAKTNIHQLSSVL